MVLLHEGKVLELALVNRLSFVLDMFTNNIRIDLRVTIWKVNIGAGL